MRKVLKEFLMDLNVPYEMGPYQTQPWSYMDIEKGQTCSAEVRMGPDGEELEAEIQMMYDTPPARKPPVEQLIWIIATKHVDGRWDVSNLRIYNQSKNGEIYDWEGKSCKLFSMCVKDLIAEKMPDFDELMKEHFKEDERFGGRRGSGTSKSPKIRPAALLDMKQGGSF